MAEAREVPFEELTGLERRAFLGAFERAFADTVQAAPEAPPLMHGNNWSGQAVIGWHVTEKLDGCRARWTGDVLLSRGGHPIRNVPAHLLASLPAGLPLDLEVYAGRGHQELTRRAVQYGRWAAEVTLVAFDAPSVPGDWAARIARVMRDTCVPCVPHMGRVTSLPGLIVALADIQRHGGEGLMLHAPGFVHTPGRTWGLLKVKSASNVHAEWAS